LHSGFESRSTVPAGWSFPFHPAEFLSEIIRV